MPDYISVPIVTDPNLLAQDGFDTLQRYYPGWTAIAGAQDTILIEHFARVAAVVRDTASAVPRSIFRYFGQTLLGLPPVAAVSATALTTWTMADNAGYTISAGTQVAIRVAGDTLVPFYVQSDVVVPNGQTVTATNGVVIVALVPGAAANAIGLTNDRCVLLDPLDYVATDASGALIVLGGASSGGSDAETLDAYLNRLSARLTLLSPRPILPRDFSILARDLPWVFRATTLDLYNPADSTSNNPRMVTVVAMDNQGNAGTSSDLTALQQYLDALREVNFVVNTMSATYTLVDVTYSAKALPGYDTAGVKGAIDAALSSYLSPLNWGIPLDGSQYDWTNQTTVRYLELTTLVDNVPGVDYVVSLTLGLAGGAQTAADHTLTGAAPLPRPGTLSGTVT